MEIEFFGANALRLSAKSAHFIIDDDLEKLGKKSITKADDVSIQTDQAVPVAAGGRLLLDAPGEFEVGDVSVKAVAVRGHRDAEGVKSATVFQFQTDDGTIVVVGHAHPDMSDEQVEQIGHADVLILPVGGNGFTLDPEGALKVIKKLSPTVVIPTYYSVSGIKTEMPQIGLDEALAKLALPTDEPKDNLKLKSTDFSSEQTRLVVLNAK